MQSTSQQWPPRFDCTLPEGSFLPGHLGVSSAYKLPGPTWLSPQSEEDTGRQALVLPQPRAVPLSSEPRSSQQPVDRSFTASWGCLLTHGLCFPALPHLCRVKQKLPTQQELGCLLMKRKDPARKQKQPRSWLPPGPRTGKLKKSRSRSAQREPKGERRRLPTCFRLRGYDVSGHLMAGSGPWARHLPRPWGHGISTEKANKQRGLQTRIRKNWGGAAGLVWPQSFSDSLSIEPSQFLAPTPYVLSYGTIPEDPGTLKPASSHLLKHESVF